MSGCGPVVGGLWALDACKPLNNYAAERPEGPSAPRPAQALLPIDNHAHLYYSTVEALPTPGQLQATRQQVDPRIPRSARLDAGGTY